MEHTKEPWEFAEWNAGVNSYPGYGLLADDRSLSVTVHMRNHKGDGYNSVDCTELTQANAARIVACVNACAGIEDPAEAIKAAREALEQIASIYEKPETPSLHELSSRAYDMRCIARATLAKLQPKDSDQ